MVRKDAHREIPFESRIPDLVRTAVLGRPDKARRAERDLFAGILQSGENNNLLITIDAVQRSILKGRAATEIKASVRLFDRMVDCIQAGLEQENLRIDIGSENARLMQAIERNHKQITENPALNQQLSDAYKNYFRTSSTEVLEAMRQSGLIPPAEITLNSTPQEVSAKIAYVEYSAWQERINKLTGISGPSPKILRGEDWDEFIDLLHEEPLKIAGIDEKFKTSPYARFEEGTPVAFQDIEELPSPLDKKGFYAILGYVTGLLDRASPGHQAIAQVLFFQPKAFSEQRVGDTALRRNDFKYASLFQNINRWQELLIYEITFNSEFTENAKWFLDTVLKRRPGVFSALIDNMVEYCAWPLSFDKEPSSSFDESRAQHPIIGNAYDEFERNNPNVDIYSTLAREVGYTYALNTLLPEMQKRLDELGFGGNAVVMSKLNQIQLWLTEQMTLMPERHAKHLEASFTKRNREGFVAQLNQKAAELNDLTQAIWNHTSVHFVPMKEGVNIIDISESSPLGKRGISSIEISRVGDDQAWETAIIFRLHGISIHAVQGTIDQTGKLNLRSPLEEQQPGIHALLNHVAVLVLQDLVTQDTGQVVPEAKDQRPTPEKTDTPVVDQEERKRSRTRPSRAKALPRVRVQKDSKLIRDVHRITRTKPYVVESHPTGILPGGKFYDEATRLYAHTVISRNDPKAIVDAENLLEEANKARHKPTAQKLAAIPRGLAKDMTQTIDPRDNRVVYLSSWVKEYSVPEPTEEERQSIHRMFERHYRGSSALSSLGATLDILDL